jgi:putative oxidoreductase
MNDSVSRMAKLGMLPLMNDAGSRFAKWGMLPLRIVVGLVFLLHGGQKLFVFGLGGTADIMGKLGLPLPVIAAAVVITVELLGGLAILLGAFARVAGALLAFEMVVAIIVARLHGGFFAPYGYEFELTLLGACLTFALSGSGQTSLEEMWRRAAKL